MKTKASILIYLLFLTGLCVVNSTGCKKTSTDVNTQPKGMYGYIYNDSTSKPISGVLIIGYRCDDVGLYEGCLGTLLEYGRSTTDTNGFFQLVYDPDAYTIYIMGYEVLKMDYDKNIYYVRHW